MRSSSNLTHWCFSFYSNWTPPGITFVPVLTSTSLANSVLVRTMYARWDSFLAWVPMNEQIVLHSLLVCLWSLFDRLAHLWYVHDVVARWIWNICCLENLNVRDIYQVVWLYITRVQIQVQMVVIDRRKNFIPCLHELRRVNVICFGYAQTE